MNLLFRFRDGWYFGSAPGVCTGCQHDGFWAANYNAHYFLCLTGTLFLSFFFFCKKKKASYLNVACSSSAYN